MLSFFRKKKNQPPEDELKRKNLKPASNQLVRNFHTTGAHYAMKIIIRGERNTGKTQLFNRLQEEPFRSEYKPTQQLQCVSIDWNYRTSDDLVKVEIWDVVDKAGPDETPTDEVGFSGRVEVNDKRSAPPAAPLVDAVSVDVYKNTHGVILMCDLSRRWTLEYCEREIESLPSNFPVALMLNYQDLKDRFIVTDAEIEALVARHPNTTVIPCCMRDGFGLQAVRLFFNVPFLMMKYQILQRQLERMRTEMDGAVSEVRLVAAELDYSGFRKWLTETASEKRRSQQVRREAPPPAPPRTPTSSVSSTFASLPSSSPALSTTSTTSTTSSSSTPPASSSSSSTTTTTTTSSSSRKTPGPPSSSPAPSPSPSPSPVAASPARPLTKEQQRRLKREEARRAKEEKEAKKRAEKLAKEQKKKEEREAKLRAKEIARAKKAGKAPIIETPAASEDLDSFWGDSANTQEPEYDENAFWGAESDDENTVVESIPDEFDFDVPAAAKPKKSPRAKTPPPPAPAPAPAPTPMPAPADDIDIGALPTGDSDGEARDDIDFGAMPTGDDGGDDFDFSTLPTGDEAEPPVLDNQPDISASEPALVTPTPDPAPVPAVEPEAAVPEPQVGEIDPIVLAATAAPTTHAPLADPADDQAAIDDFFGGADDGAAEGAADGADFDDWLANDNDNVGDTPAVEMEPEAAPSPALPSPRKTPSRSVSPAPRSPARSPARSRSPAPPPMPEPTTPSPPASPKPEPAADPDDPFAAAWDSLGDDELAGEGGDQWDDNAWASFAATAEPAPSAPKPAPVRASAPSPTPPAVEVRVTSSFGADGGFNASSDDLGFGDSGGYCEMGDAPAMPIPGTAPAERSEGKKHHKKHRKHRHHKH